VSAAVLNSAIPEGLEAAVPDQAIAAGGGDAREAVKALLIANGFLEKQIAALQAAVSTGYARGGLLDVPRDRKDGYDGCPRLLITSPCPFVVADGGIAPAEPIECFNPNAAVLRAEALSHKPGSVGAVA
jgi:hypothetical protein